MRTLPALSHASSGAAFPAPSPGIAPGNLGAALAWGIQHSQHSPPAASPSPGSLLSLWGHLALLDNSHWHQLLLPAPSAKLQEPVPSARWIWERSNQSPGRQEGQINSAHQQSHLWQTHSNLHPALGRGNLLCVSLEQVQILFGKLFQELHDICQADPAKKSCPGCSHHKAAGDTQVTPSR